MARDNDAGPVAGELQPWGTQIRGILFSLGLSIGLPVLLHMFVEWWDIFFSIGLAIFAWLWFWFAQGEVPLTFQGVGTFLGARRRKKYNEGKHWIFLYPLANIRNVERTEKTLEISSRSQNAKDKGGAQVSGIITNNKVEMLVDGSVQYEVVDGQRYLGIDESVIENGQRDNLIAVAGKMAETMDDTEFMLNKGKLERKVRAAAQRQAKKWGIRIKKVNIKRILPLREEVQQANERGLIEKRQTESEAIELDGVEKRINRLTRPKNRGGAGLTQDQAVDLVQSERGKVVKTVSDIRVRGDGNSLVGAAAAGAQILGAQRNQQGQQGQGNRRKKKRGQGQNPNNPNPNPNQGGQKKGNGP